jgi:exodeoxyribonuclease V gamma subunit
MSLHLHRAPRTDQLAGALGELLSSPLADPFAQEVVVVPAKGVERWLTQRLSHRLGVGPRGGDGVCAGVRFLTPRSLVSLLLGRERDDRWDPERLVWPLLSTIDASLDEPWCATLAAHLGRGRDGDEGELRRNRRYSVAIRLAFLFASYAVQRPQLVTDWREGRDTDGAGSPLDDDLVWQAELWRRLLTRVDADPPDVRHAATVAALRAGAHEIELPARLSLFGHTRIPVTEVELLRALGEVRDVHLWLPQPSPALWHALSGLGGVVARDDDTSAELVDHPLLASLGRDSRELRRTLQGPRPRATAFRSRSRAPCWAGSSTTSGPTTPRRPTSAPCAGPLATTAASRCTPATAPRARSTCSARCWSVFSRTTRPSSRATSW